MTEEQLKQDTENELSTSYDNGRPSNTKKRKKEHEHDHDNDITSNKRITTEGKEIEETSNLKIISSRSTRSTRSNPI